MEIFYILPPLLILVAGVVGIRRLLKDHSRIQILRELARSLGLQYRRAKDYSFEHHYPGFDFLKWGNKRYAFNIISGQWNAHEVIGFDYHYEIELDNQNTNLHVDFSAIIIESPFELKPLIIRPEALFDKMTAAFGWDDINFESAEFSRKFHVKAEDRRWAYQALSPIAIESLLESPQYEVQLSNRHLILRGKIQFEPWEFKKAFEISETILNGIPEFAKS